MLLVHYLYENANAWVNSYCYFATDREDAIRWIRWTLKDDVIWWLHWNWGQDTIYDLMMDDTNDGIINTISIWDYEFEYSNNSFELRDNWDFDYARYKANIVEIGYKSDVASAL
jgi:hypothetical protein